MARQTKAQQEAQDRSFYILRLRGLWIQASMIQNLINRETVQKAIDAELIGLGAQSQTDRQAYIRQLNRRALDGDKEAEREYLRLTKPVKLHRNRIPF